MTHNPPTRQLDLDAIQARIDAASKGPWKLAYEYCDCSEDCGHGLYVSRIDTGSGPATELCDLPRGEWELMVHARTDVEQLVAEVRRLRAAPPMECINCETPVGWVDCPTGGWWAHETHPADGHDADPRPARHSEPATEDTLPAWLAKRFDPRGADWDGMSDDDRAYWAHQAAAVRRAVARGGFKATTPA